MIYIQKHSSVLLSQLQSSLRKETGPSVTFFSLSGTAYSSNTKSLSIFARLDDNAKVLRCLFFLSGLLKSMSMSLCICICAKTFFFRQNTSGLSRLSWWFFSVGTAVERKCSFH